MVHLMGLPECAEVHIVCAVKPVKALMDQHIMHEKVARSVHHDTQSDKKPEVESVFCSEQHEHKAGYREDEEEEIILFEEARFGLVMVFMEVPHKTVHNKFMGAPGDPFHKGKSAERNE